MLRQQWFNADTLKIYNSAQLIIWGKMLSDALCKTTAIQVCRPKYFIVFKIFFFEDFNLILTQLYLD